MEWSEYFRVSNLCEGHLFSTCIWRLWGSVSRLWLYRLCECHSCFTFSFATCIVRDWCLRHFPRQGKEFYPLHILRVALRYFRGRGVLAAWFRFRERLCLWGFRCGTWWFFWQHRSCLWKFIWRDKLQKSFLIQFFWWLGSPWRTLCVCTS